MGPDPTWLMSPSEDDHGKAETQGGSVEMKTETGVKQLCAKERQRRLENGRTPGRAEEGPSHMFPGELGPLTR